MDNSGHLKIAKVWLLLSNSIRENVISISLALQAADVQVTEVESNEKGSACVSFSQTNELIVWPEVNYSSHVRFVLTLCTLYLSSGRYQPYNGKIQH